MKTEDLITTIRMNLSGGNLVDVEVKDDAIRSYIGEAFDKAKPWFYDNEKYETVPIISAQADSGYVPFSNLSKTPADVVAVYNTSQTGMGSFDNDVAGLLSLEGRHIISQNLVAGAYALQFERQADTFLNTLLKHQIIDDKIFVSGAVIDNTVTVRYRPKPETFDDVVNTKAIDWMKSYALAQTKVALGRVRSKWRGGDLEVENDGQDLISEGTTEMNDLISKLSELGF